MPSRFSGQPAQGYGAVPLTSKEADAMEALTKREMRGVRLTANPNRAGRIRDPETKVARPITRQERHTWTT